MAHEIVPAAEEILDREFPVLDKGFVILVDYMGGDNRIVQSARVSYGSGTKSIRDDAGLIDYLMRHKHTSPFEQVSLTFHAKMPIFVARQWIRHRTAKLNEISGRYSVMRDEFYVPEDSDINLQSTGNKQGRSTEEIPKELREEVREILQGGQKDSYEDYEYLIGEGIAKELARINLPLSLYTEWYWKSDLHNLFHFLNLRMDPHAQWEIRQYANVMAEITKKVAPIAYESFENHQRNSITFSQDELALVRQAMQIEDQFGLEKLVEQNFSSKGRREEFLDKIGRIRKLDLS